MSRHLGPTLSTAEEHGVRRMELAFAEWMSGDERFRHLEVTDLAVRLQGLRNSRRDLLRRRGERRPDRVLTSITPTDVELLVAQSSRQAELLGLERFADLRTTCASWSDYLQFLLEEGWWDGDRRSAATVGGLLHRHRRVVRGELLQRGGHSVRTSFPVELVHLRRTGLVREAEEVLRGRSTGTARVRTQLQDLGFLGRDGRRGDRWQSWDSAKEGDAGCARRRLVVAEVVRALRTPDDGCARALALATSERPVDVAEGARLVEALVGRGDLGDLVAAGVVPGRAPWRIPRGLQHSVHVGLSRLVDDGVLDADLRRPVLEAAG